MISDVDDALRELIKNSLSVSREAVDIKFDQPTREWMSRLNRPTINLFLFDIRENLRLRGAEQYESVHRNDGMVEVHRNPVRIDLRYLLTAWTREPEDEHLLLSDALITLLRNTSIPEEFLSDSLRAQKFPIVMDAAVWQPEHGPTEKITDIWGVLGNDLHAGFIVTITITVDPYAPAIYPAVRSLERKLGQSDGKTEQLYNPSRSKQSYVTACRVNSEKYTLSTLSAVLCEKKLSLPIDERGFIRLPELEEGTYYIDIIYNGKVIKHQQYIIPSDDYEIVL